MDADGRPVGGATLAAEQKGYLRATTRTNAKGQYVLSGLLHAPARVSARFPGEPPAWCAPVRSLSADVVKRGATVRFVGERGVLLTARLIGKQDGEPVTEDITVQCDGAAGLQATPVNKDGTIYYRTPPGRVTVLPRDPGETRSAIWERRGLRHDCWDFTVRGDRSVDLRVQTVRRGPAAVRVVGPDGRPVSQAMVTADSRLRTVTARTDRNGIARLEGVPRSFSLYAQATTGMFAQYANVRTEPDSSPSTIQLARTVERDVRFEDERGDPIDGVKVRFTCGTVLVRETTSNGLGHARAPMLREHQYRVEWDLGALTGVANVSAFKRDPKTGEVLEDEPPLETVITLGRHSVSGTVVDQVGQPVRDAYTHVERENWPANLRMGGTVQVDHRGRFTVPGLPAGEVTLTAVALGVPEGIVGASTALTIDVDERDVRLVVLPLEPGKVTVRVVGPLGRPIADARVDLYRGDAIRKAMRAYEDHAPLIRQNRPVQSGHTGRDGRTVVGPLERDPYELVVTKPGWSLGSRGFSEPYVGRRNLTLALERPASIEGRVRLEDGEPVAGAEVVLSSVTSETPYAGLSLSFCEPPEFRTATDGNGRFVLQGVPRGFREVGVFVRAPGYRAVYVTAGGLNEAILKTSDALKSAITGRVMDERAGPPGKPAAGVTVICLGGGSVRKTVTGPDGRYRFDSLPACRHSVWLKPPTAEPGAASPWTYRRQRRVELREKKTTAGVNFALASGVLVSGRILDENGDPIPNLLVSLAGERALAGAQGRWICRVLPGTYRPSVLHRYEGFRWREGNREITIPADQPTTGIDFHLIAEASPSRPNRPRRTRASPSARSFPPGSDPPSPSPRSSSL